MEVGFQDSLKVTFSMLTTLISWCECYISAHIKRNNYKIPFNLILLINAVSVIFFDDFLKLWEGNTWMIQWKRKGSPIRQIKACDQVSKENILYPTQSHVLRDSPMGCFVKESPLLFSWYRSTFPKDVKVNTFLKFLKYTQISTTIQFFLWIEKDKCL